MKKYTDYDFSEIQEDIKDVIKIIETECDCDCDEMNGFKTCGRCQAILRLKQECNLVAQGEPNIKDKIKHELHKDYAKSKQGVSIKMTSPYWEARE